MLPFFPSFRSFLPAWLMASSPLLLAAGPAGLIQIEVPDGLMDVEGNDFSRLPFGYEYPNIVRYQQVYDASAFSLVPPGGAFVTRIFFRADCTPGWGPVVTNLQINLCTTIKAV